MISLKEIKDSVLQLKDKINSWVWMGYSYLADKGIEVSEPITIQKLIESINLIHDYVFEVKGMIMGTLTSIDVPEGVDKIKASCFSNMIYLTKVTLPNSVKEIGNGAFQSCASLQIINLPSTLETIGSSAFKGTKIYNTNTNWKDDVLYIGEYLIEAKTTKAGDYEIEDGTRIICPDAFMTSNLTRIKIPKTVIKIANSCFYYSTKLTEVEFDGSYDDEPIKEIGSSAFRNVGITEIVIPRRVEEINASAFLSCSNLTTIKVAWPEGTVPNAPWGATKATIIYDFLSEE